ncbi:MAG: FAD-binding oxidoreductase [Thermodesulfobacteriota bacterium]|nr:FAD-binding oxidoreductase [Thermodesulfobacteriota bacterium]
MGLSREIYQTLESIVGSENISDDPAICEADFKGGAGEFIHDRGAIRPACVILPGNTSEVREIVRVATRYNLPFIPFSTFYIAFCSPKRPNAIMMDLKRMNRLEIDDKNMYAIVEPGVSVSQLQAESMKRGLYVLSPGCGSQASVLANTAVHGQSPLGYRMGYSYRRILATEWVLPDGDVLNLGSTSIMKEYFWGEGPGPDLRGILRGLLGPLGGLGVVTRMAVKLFPFVTQKLEPTGISPHTTLQLPQGRMKWFNIIYPSLEKAIDAMYEIARNEIGVIVMSVPPVFRFVARARGKGANDFWEHWKRAGETMDREQIIVRVLLIGFTSGKQLAHEERILTEIAAETEGILKEAKPTDESWIMSADSVSIFFVGGAEASVGLSLDSLDQGMKLGKATRVLKKKYTPPLGEDYNFPGWFQVQEMGHMSYFEYLTFGNIEDSEKLGQLAEECVEQDMKMGGYTYYQDPGILGPKWYNFHILYKRIKEIFDPGDVSNPPKPLSLE